MALGMSTGLGRLKGQFLAHHSKNQSKISTVDHVNSDTNIFGESSTSQPLSVFDELSVHEQIFLDSAFWMLVFLYRCIYAGPPIRLFVQVLKAVRTRAMFNLLRAGF